ncbi:copper radical oxidase [Aplosporella prunicola CBS 121167]|uniref:Copper radical oxidase n=1 Tax=Aplosporella prunicola CBS 121167 TaxID=1176127 RepID=A0A6A6BTM7_9PEZI|nr:copper radical oxidase [Aplosporella prunicola CBS 121167]KAF2146187.1 copper radical oxidase [Aplosporella prunicola CBS 121167]
MQSRLLRAAALATVVHQAAASGFRTVGSSGVAAQLLFLPPYTDKAVFLDNYHANYGGPGVDLATGAHSTEPYNYDGTNTAVFATEYDLKTNTLRKLHPQTNTFCSAGAFLPDGTMVNFAGAEPDAKAGVGDGFNGIRTYPPGPCAGDVCDMDFTVNKAYLQAKRWYPGAETLPNGDVLAVGGSNVGGLVLNEASINVPTYELVKADGSAPPPPVTLPILEFTDAENNQPNKSYNLYPILHLMPNPRAASEVFTVAGNQAIIWDYHNDKLVKTLPDTPLEPRTFPSSATSILLPLEAPDYEPTVLMCGGSSGDIPDPQALDDCYTIQPHAENPVWETDDNLPNGPQVMTDGINLPDGTILFINGAHRGSGGGFQADDPARTPFVYNPKAPRGTRFTNMPASSIPRLYHSVATLLPSGEVLVAGSNPMVGYTADGGVPAGWPKFGNNGHTAFLNQQQRETSKYPTEYRVEIFSPRYMDAVYRPQLLKAPEAIFYGKTFAIKSSMESEDLEVVIINPGFHTHGMNMQQRMIKLQGSAGKASGQHVVTAPPGPSTAQPGVYLMFVVVDGIPSEGKWVKLSY